MPDRRGRKGSVEDLLPEDRVTWARQIWAERGDVANSPSGAWMLREAASRLRSAETRNGPILIRLYFANQGRELRLTCITSRRIGLDSI